MIEFRKARNILVLIFISLLFVAPTVHAVSISPALVEVSLDKGTIKNGAITITNTEDRAISYEVGFQNFVAKGEEGQQDFVDANSINRDVEWITPQSEGFILEKGQEIDFQYSVSVPKDAIPGGHYVAMFFSESPKQDENGSGASVSAKIGVLFFVRVNGEIVENLQVDSFRTIQTGIGLNRLPITFETRFKNTGNVHIRPEGEIVIKNIFGKVTDSIPLNPKASLVLVNSVRRTESEWKKEQQGRVTGWFTEARNELNNFAIGPYAAEIQGYYGENRSPLTQTTHFWVIPWHLLIIVGAFLALLLILNIVYRSFLIKVLLKRSIRR